LNSFHHPYSADITADLALAVTLTFWGLAG
ncbi:hypothetical protein U647_02812, partial [Staphylococcus aureus M16552]